MRNVLWTAWRAGRPAVLCLVALLIASPLCVGLVRPALAQALKGEVSATTENGYARLAFKFEDEIEAQVRLANNVVTINFPRPVDISIDRISQYAAGYVSAARRDPDGKGIRIALARKVTMNSMAAGERLFVDFLARHLDRSGARIAARRHRRACQARARGRTPHPSAARVGAAAKVGGGPGEGDHPADLRALRVRSAGTHRRVRGQYQGQG